MTTLGEVAAKSGLPFDHVDYACPRGYHDDEYSAAHCMFCDGGLFACTVCGSFEGATTTQCPGRKMTEAECDDVYNSSLDYRNGHWVAQPSWYCPGGYYNWAWDYEEVS